MNWDIKRYTRESNIITRFIKRDKHRWSNKILWNIKYNNKRKYNGKGNRNTRFNKVIDI